MKFDRRDFGFWKNLNELDVGEAFGLEALIAGIIVDVGCIALLGRSNLVQRVTLAEDCLSLDEALLGVIFAAFALVVSLLSDRYLLFVQRQPNGARVFLRPFMVNIGLQVGIVIGTI